MQCTRGDHGVGGMDSHRTSFFLSRSEEKPRVGIFAKFQRFSEISKIFPGPYLGLHHASDFFGSHLQVEEVADKVGIVGNG